MSKKVTIINPAPKRKKMATKKRTNPATKTNPRRRYRRRRNPAIHPALMATLGTLAGAAVGGGADIGLRYTSLSPYVRGGILIGTGVLGGLGLSFLDPALGAGVGGGCGSVGLSEVILQATAPSPTDEAAGTGSELAAVRAELGRVTAQLGALPRMPALQEANAASETVYVEEGDLAYL